MFIGGPVVTNGGTLPTAPADLQGYTFNFSNISPSNVNAANLAPYDTVILNVASSAMGQNTTALSATAKADLVTWVGQGHKLIIYDSECTPAGGVDYSWLPFPFTTNNPGAWGGFNGTLTDVENNTLSSAVATDPRYINASLIATNTDAVGDSNVMVTLDPNWKVDMTATNVNNVSGPVHTYAEYGGGGGVGLMIYNGLDVDYINYTSGSTGQGAAQLRNLYLYELLQPFNPSGLPGTISTVGITLLPATASEQVGQTHTVTATLKDILGNPQVGVPVSFQLLAGPNMGASGSTNPTDGKSDANGQVTFTYIGSAVGTDTLTATFQNANNQTIASAPANVDWIRTTSVPLATDDGYVIHNNNTLAVPTKGVLSNDSDPDPAHVPALTAQLVGQAPTGLTFQTDGSFSYVPAAGATGLVTFQYQAFDGTDLSNTATVTIQVMPPISIEMDPNSDSGVSSSDQVTNDSTPAFMGSAEAGSMVTLTIVSANKSGVALPGTTPITIGPMTPGSDNTWTLVSSSLADGYYSVSVTEEHPQTPSRGPETSTLPGVVLIDTAGPRVMAFRALPCKGQVILTFQDSGSGLVTQQMEVGAGAVKAGRTLAGQRVATQQAAGISIDVTGYYAAAAFPVSVTKVVASSSGGPTAPRVVTATINGGRPLRTGCYVIMAMGAEDRAGNMLDGEYLRMLPSGDDSPGGRFRALLRVCTGGVVAIQPIPENIVTPVPKGGILETRPAAATKVKAVPASPVKRTTTAKPAQVSTAAAASRYVPVAATVKRVGSIGLI